MGTRVQCKSYISGYHHIRDLNGDATFSWSHLCEDKTFSAPLCNDLKLRRVGSWMDYNKEMLKQTMLEHEAIFQKQVYELHRLYRIQKQLMHEHKEKELNRFSGPLETSNSSMFQSQMLPEFRQSIWHLPHQPLENTCQGTENFTYSDGNRSSLNFLEENATKCSPISTKIGVGKDDIPLDTKLKKFPKKMLDLHLPADAYIEDDDVERTERENTTEACSMAAETCNMISGIESKNNFKLTISEVVTPVLEKDLLKSKLADLNEPCKDSCEEGTLGSDTHKCSSLDVHSEEIQQPSTWARSKSNYSQRNLFIDQRRDGVSLNSLDASKVETGREWLPLHSDSAQSENVAKPFNFSFFDAKYPMSSESIKLRLDKAREKNHKDTWLGERTTHCSEFSETPHFNSNHTGNAASKVTSPLSAASPLTCATATSPLNSSGRYESKGIHHIPIAAEALPCFSSPLSSEQNKSYSVNKQSKNNHHDTVQCKGDRLPQMILGNESSHSNGFHHGIQMYSSLTGIHLSPSNLEKANLNNGNTSPYENSDNNEAWKCSKDPQYVGGESAKDLNLNRGTLRGIRNGFTENNLTRMYDESSKSLTWFGEIPSCNGSVECDSRLDLRLIKDYSLTPKFLGEEVKDKGSSLNHSFSSLDIKERKIQASILTDRLNSNGILNPPDSCQRNFYSLKSASYDRESVADELKSCGNKKAVGSQGLREEINLNSDLVPIEDELFDVSDIDETSFPSSISLARIAGKLTRKIDLEAPADEMEEENILSGVEIVDMMIPAVKPVAMFQENILPEDSPIKLAADIMVSMSVDVHNHVDTVISYPIALSSCDLLHLLAEVVMSNAETGGVSKGTNDDDGDGMDIFESMTLKLEELKVDEYCCKPYQPEKPMVDEKSMASLLFTRPRRMQARKRRQKRDFQRDILPAIASLSRHEVTEDLQALGGVTRATKSRQAAATRRSTTQNGSSPSGRRRPRSLAITITEVDDNPPQIQPIHAELEYDGGNIMTWGRTTRRCRRQRMPPGHASAPRK